jgi:Zn-dependent protease/CBS domain-containing protein
LSGTFQVGSLFGFKINVHWTWFFIFFLVTWTFATGVLEEAYSDWNEARRWTVAIAIALVFFLSILLHEVSHSIVARKYGIPVSGITLFVFGGVSNMTREPETSKQEFWIAVVGPFTSFGLGLLFAAGYFILSPVEDGAAAVSGNLAIINIAIGIFNLLPGFPLDGGRVLRSAFWARRRSLVDATRTASTVGLVVAYGMMALGVILFFLGLFVTGIWLFLIGTFLRSASVESYEQVFLDNVLRTVPASAVAKQDYVTVGPELPLADLVEDHILAGDGRCFPVVVEGQLLGLITLNDVRKVPRDQWKTTSVYRAMTPLAELHSVTMRDNLPKVLAEMAAGDFDQVPLLDGKTLLGLIHRADVVRYIQVRQEMMPKP